VQGLVRLCFALETHPRHHALHPHLFKGWGLGLPAPARPRPVGEGAQGAVASLAKNRKLFEGGGKRLC